jgi:hypothetical protein
MKLIVLAPLLLVAACAKPVSEMNYAEISQLATEIKARCAADGADPGTPQYSSCAKVEAQYEINRRNRRFFSSSSKSRST